MLIYKVNLLEELKKKGYSTYKLRNEKILSESQIQKIRNGEIILGKETLNTICNLLGYQISDFILFVSDDEV